MKTIASLAILGVLFVGSAAVADDYREVWECKTKDGKTRIVAIFAKRARGMMADYILRNRIEKADDIKKFNAGGYRFSRELSDDAQWTFVRPQPPSA